MEMTDTDRLTAREAQGNSEIERSPRHPARTQRPAANSALPPRSAVRSSEWDSPASTQVSLRVQVVASPPSTITFSTMPVVGTVLKWGRESFNFEWHVTVRRSPRRRRARLDPQHVPAWTEILQRHPRTEPLSRVLSPGWMNS